ncbi:uncharacterized protein J8A68_004467 [[Candida] subhashii]|uniref:Fibronectin type-III domain-containing protein n=1 Tax=[Candida] subhashii TaxID=561895 RepID=A0A8J5UKD6_9ASCO|nr:uncharacterized protein J8A68_004467 [[Candida] subhashii]KAG7661967.1 hypothetical protein J8A68_004467 [[Candida] subhashii]
MIEILITLVPSLVWLFYRFYLILCTPVERLIEDLNIEIPHTPNICIDSISSNSVVIHWDIEVKNDENLYYVVVVNGTEVATLTCTSCKLNNLEKGIYEIFVIAINSITSFRSQSKSVYVEMVDGVGFIDDGKLEDVVEEKALDISASSGSGAAGGDEDGLESITIDQIKSIDSADLLNDYLMKFQNDLIRVNLEYKQFQNNSVKDQENLQQELNFYKSEFEEETDNKVKKDNDVKSLERSKDVLVFRKSKLISQLNLLKNSINLYNTKIKENEAKIKKLQERNAQALNNESQEVSKINEKITKVKQSIEKTKVDYESVEENLRNLYAERKDLISLLNQVKPLIEVFNQTSAASPPISDTSSPSPGPAPPSSSGTSNTPPSTGTPVSIFNKDGSITKPAFEALVKIFQIMPNWQDEIMNEINNYQEFETKWREAFKNEIQNYVTVHHALEMIKHNRDPNYQPAKMNDYMASIDFGGYSNALPKPPKYRRNFSPSVSSFDETTHKNYYYNHYNQVYGNENDMNALQPPLAAQQQPQQSSPLFQNPQIVVPQSAPQPTVLTTDYMPTQYQQPQQQYISLDQINAQAHALDLGNASIDANLFSGSSNPTFESNPYGNPATLQGFPYDDQIYTTSITSPIPNHNTTNTQNLLSYGDYNSLLYQYNSPKLTHTALSGEMWKSTPGAGAATVTNPAAGGYTDLLGSANNPQSSFLMTPSTSSKIWIDDGVGGSAGGTGHNRTVSSGSQLWRNDLLNTPNTNIPIVNVTPGAPTNTTTGAPPPPTEFQPFGSSPIQLGGTNTGGANSSFFGPVLSNKEDENKHKLY